MKTCTAQTKLQSVRRQQDKWLARTDNKFYIFKSDKTDWAGSQNLGTVYRFTLKLNSRLFPSCPLRASVQAYLQSHLSPISSTYLLPKCASCIPSPAEDKTLHSKALPFTQDRTQRWFLQAAILVLVLHRMFDSYPSGAFTVVCLCSSVHLSTISRDFFDMAECCLQSMSS